MQKQVKKQVQSSDFFVSISVESTRISINKASCENFPLETNVNSMRSLKIARSSRQFCKINQRSKILYSDTDTVLLSVRNKGFLVVRANPMFCQTTTISHGTALSQELNNIQKWQTTR